MCTGCRCVSWSRPPRAPGGTLRPPLPGARPFSRICCSAGILSLAASGGRRIATTVDALAARVHGFRLAGDVLSGCTSSPSTPRRRSAASWCRSGELGQIAAWMASGARRGGTRSTPTGSGSRPPPGRGRAAGGTVRGQPRLPLDEQRPGAQGAGAGEGGHWGGRAGRPTKARVLFLDRVAWAHTRAGQPALRASERRTPPWTPRRVLRRQDGRTG